MMTEEIIIGEEHNAERADKAITEIFTDKSRSFISKLFEDGLVEVNGSIVTKSCRLKENDRVRVTFTDPVCCNAEPENIPLDVVYEDDELLVVNKPKGMVVHPAAGNYSKTLVNALLFHCGSSLSGINGVLRPGIVHRIDKDTSGLLIVAKNDNSHRILAKQIKDHSFTREYEAVVYGNLKDDCGTVDAPIGRHPVKRKQMCVTDKNSKNAVTHYTVIKRYNGFTHVRLKLETGRTHQIRVHMAYINHPVLGDEVYCSRKNSFNFLKGQCLHAKKIGFIHPKTGDYMEFDSELPDYFKEILSRLKEV